MAYSKKTEIYGPNSIYGFKKNNEDGVKEINIVKENASCIYFPLNDFEDLNDIELAYLNYDYPIPEALTPQIKKISNNFKVKTIDINIFNPKKKIFYFELLLDNELKKELNVNGGRVFIPIQFLSAGKIPLVLDYESIKNTFKEYNKSYQIPNLSPQQWEENFFLDFNAKETEWVYKRSFVLKDNINTYIRKPKVFSDRDGEVFFDKKTGCYCASVLTNFTTAEEIKNYDLKNNIVYAGIEGIFDFLNIKIEEGASLPVDYAFILDANNEYYEKDRKIKFLVAIPHRYIFYYINNTSKLTSLKFTEDLLTIILLNSPKETWINLYDLVISTIPDGDKLLDEYGDAKTFFSKTLDQSIEENIPFDLRDIENLKNKIPEVFNGALDLLAKGIFGPSTVNVDIPINKKDPYISFNYSQKNIIDVWDDETEKPGKEASEFLMKKLKKILDDYAKKYPKFLKNHDVTPDFDFNVLSKRIENLYNNLYQYSIDKIVAKELVSPSEAERLIESTSLFLQGDPSTPSDMFANVSDFFKVISIQIRYNNNNSIIIGSSKSLDFEGITEITDKSILFLYYQISSIIDSIKTQPDLPTESFIKSYIYPERSILWKPDPNNPNEDPQCYENFKQNLANEWKRQTLNARKSLYSLNSNEWAKEWEANKKGGIEAWRNGVNFASSFTDPDAFVGLILSNLDTTVLMSLLVDCLNKKGFPVELIARIAEFLMNLIKARGNIFCLIPPFKLPQIPILDINFELKTVDIMGALYKALEKLISDLFSKLIIDSFKALLDQLLNCEGAFGDVSWGNSIDNFLNKPRDLKNPSAIDKNSDINNNIGRGQEALTAGGSTTTQETQEIITEYQNSSDYTARASNFSILKEIIPEFSAVQDKIPSIIEEFKILADSIQSNFPVPQFINLLAGQPSKDIEWFIRDIVAIDPRFKNMDDTRVFEKREKIVSIFTKFGSLMNQDLITEAVNSFTELRTDINALCEDISRRGINNDTGLTDQQISDLANKYGPNKVNIIRNKILTKQINVIKSVEKILDPNGFKDSIPNVNDLMPKSPHASEMFAAKNSLKAPFDTIKKLFNEEVITAKYSFIGTKTVKKNRYIDGQKKIVEKMYPGLDPDDKDDKKELEKRAEYYSNVIQVNPYLFSILNNFPKSVGQKTTVKLLPPIPNLDQLDDLINSGLEDLDEKIINRIKNAKTNIYKGLSKFDDKLILIDKIQDAQDITKLSFKIEIFNKKLFNNSNSKTLEGYYRINPNVASILNNLTNLSATQNNNANNQNNIQITAFDDLPYEQKLFCILLFNNNIIINYKKRNGSIDSSKTNYFNELAKNLKNLYLDIYDNILVDYKKTVSDTGAITLSSEKNKDIAKQGSLIDEILNSTFMNLGSDNKPNIFNIPLESYQTDKCIEQSGIENHLLKLENEKKKILKYYSDNKQFDEARPEDGSSYKNIHSLQLATLYSYIDIFFKISLYDYMIRALPVFNNNNLPLDLDFEIMSKFFYNIIIEDRHFKKLKSVTQNYKHLRDYYKYLNNINSATDEEAIQYFLNSNLKIVLESLQKKFIKGIELVKKSEDAKLTEEERSEKEKSEKQSQKDSNETKKPNKNILEKALENFSTITIDDENKTIIYDTGKVEEKYKDTKKNIDNYFEIFNTIIDNEKNFFKSLLSTGPEKFILENTLITYKKDDYSNSNMYYSEYSPEYINRLENLYIVWSEQRNNPSDYAVDQVYIQKLLNQPTINYFCENYDYKELTVRRGDTSEVEQMTLGIKDTVKKVRISKKYFKEETYESNKYLSYADTLEILKGISNKKYSGKVTSSKKIFDKLFVQGYRKDFLQTPVYIENYIEKTSDTDKVNKIFRYFQYNQFINSYLKYNKEEDYYYVENKKVDNQNVFKNTSLIEDQITNKYLANDYSQNNDGENYAEFSNETSIEQVISEDYSYTDRTVNSNTKIYAEFSNEVSTEQTPSEDVIFTDRIENDSIDQKYFDPLSLNQPPDEDYILTDRDNNINQTYDQSSREEFYIKDNSENKLTINDVIEFFKYMEEDLNLVDDLKFFPFPLQENLSLQLQKELLKNLNLEFDNIVDLNSIKDILKFKILVDFEKNGIFPYYYEDDILIKVKKFKFTKDNPNIFKLIYGKYREEFETSLQAYKNRLNYEEKILFSSFENIFSLFDLKSLEESVQISNISISLDSSEPQDILKVYKNLLITLGYSINIPKLRSLEKNINDFKLLQKDIVDLQENYNQSNSIILNAIKSDTGKKYIVALVPDKIYEKENLIINNTDINIYSDINYPKNKYVLVVLTKYPTEENITNNQANNQTNNQTNNQQINESNEIINTINDFFNFIFNTKSKSQFTLMVLTSICQMSEIDDNNKIFTTSKLFILKNMQNIINNGYDYMSDTEQEDKYSYELPLIIKAALALPKVIVKGISEAVDPNIALSSKISLAVKISKSFIEPIDPEAAKKIPEIPVPVISIPLGFTLPFLFTPLTIAYLALCGEGGSDEQDQKNLYDKFSSLSSDSNANNICEIPDPEL